MIVVFPLKAIGQKLRVWETMDSVQTRLQMLLLFTVKLNYQTINTLSRIQLGQREVSILLRKAGILLAQVLAIFVRVIAIVLIVIALVTDAFLVPESKIAVCRVKVMFA